MTSPDEIARRIEDYLAGEGVFLKPVNRDYIAAALEEHGEQEYLRGRLDEGQEAIKLWSDLKAKADAKGYRRGREYQKSLCLCEGRIEGHGKHEHQRSQEDGK